MSEYTGYYLLIVGLSGLGLGYFRGWRLRGFNLINKNDEPRKCKHFKDKEHRFIDNICYCGEKLHQ